MIPLISAIILAAGESKRMGLPKQLMPLGRNTILGQTIDNFLDSKVSEIIVVLGYRAQKIIGTIANRPVKVALNTRYQQGMGASLSVGLNLINDKVQGIMIALADQPFVGKQTIDSLIEAFSSNNKGIIIPIHRGERGHPVIFHTKYKQELLALKGDVGGREIIARHQEDVLELIFDSDDIVNDIDTEDKYNLERNKIIKMGGSAQQGI